MFEWWPIEIYDPEIEEYEQKPLVQEITRAISRGMLFSIEFIREILLGGKKTIVAFTSWDFVRDNEWAVWPALPWTVVAGGAILLGFKLQGKGWLPWQLFRPSTLPCLVNGNPPWRRSHLY